MPVNPPIRTNIAGVPAPKSSPTVPGGESEERDPREITGVTKVTVDWVKNVANTRAIVAGIVGIITTLVGVGAGITVWVNSSAKAQVDIALEMTSRKHDTLAGDLDRHKAEEAAHHELVVKELGNQREDSRALYRFMTTKQRQERLEHDGGTP